jgi:hypothetical protein
MLLLLANHPPRFPFSNRERPLILRVTGTRISELCLIWGPITIRPIGSTTNIEIGAHVYQYGYPFRHLGGVVIGKEVLSGQQVCFESTQP